MKTNSKKMILNNDEVAILEKITSISKMDCWFSLYHLNVNKFGTRVKDLEKGRIISLRQGVKLINEGISNVDDYDLSKLEIETFESLLKKLRLQK